MCMKFYPQRKPTEPSEARFPELKPQTEMTVNTVQQIKGINLLKLTGHVILHQFNIQELYVLPTLYLCVMYLSENKQRLVPLLRTLIGFYYRDEKCLQRGTDGGFK